MNSLKKSEGVPFLNFEGGPGFRDPEVPGPGVLVPLLHHAEDFYLY